MKRSTILLIASNLGLSLSLFFTINYAYHRWDKQVNTQKTVLENDSKKGHQDRFENKNLAPASSARRSYAS